jgi:undecaprenyl pyrophosphate synthase
LCFNFYRFNFNFFENFINRPSTERDIIEKLVLKALDSFIENKLYEKINIELIGEK